VSKIKRKAQQKRESGHSKRNILNLCFGDPKVAATLNHLKLPFKTKEHCYKHRKYSWTLFLFVPEVKEQKLTTSMTP